MIAGKVEGVHRQVGHHIPHLLQDLRRRTLDEFPALPVAIQPGTWLHDQREQGQVPGLHGVDDLGAGLGVLQPSTVAVQPQQDHGPQVQPRLPQHGTRPQHLFRGDPLDHLLQQGVTPALYPEVDPGQAGLPQGTQLLRGLFQGGLGPGEGGYLLQRRECKIQGLEDAQQILRGQADGVAVAQEHPGNVAVVFLCHQDVLQDIPDGTHMVALVLVHAAKRAGIVGAPHGDLEQIAVPFAGRAVDVAFVSHGLSSVSYSDYISVYWTCARCPWPPPGQSTPPGNRGGPRR